MEAPIATHFEGRDRAVLEQFVDARGMHLEPGGDFVQGEYAVHSIGLDRDSEGGCLGRDHRLGRGVERVDVSVSDAEGLKL